ncbi:MAG: VOC family protein [Bacteroidetes bacterium]|nr:VOC family protein [Bacteroidota bacterium]
MSHFKIRNVLFATFLFSVSFSFAQPKPHVNHTTIFVTDLARASAFYSKVMLLDSIAEPFHDHHHTWFDIGNHAQLHVVSGATADIAHDINIHLAFSVKSLPEFMKHLDAMNIKYGDWKGDKKVQMRPDNISQIYLQDPDGYWIEVNDDKF